MIYALLDPLTYEIRYVGRSSYGLKRARSKHSAWCENWRQKLKRQGIDPITLIVEVFPNTVTNDELDNAEIFWITKFKSQRYNLTNLTDGGHGRKGYSLSDSTKLKISSTRLERKITPWNKNKKNVQEAWNKGKKNIYSSQALEKMRLAKMNNTFAKGKGK